jgi:hypothetical protein
MANYYVTYWMQEHGKEKFIELMDKISVNANVPEKIKKLNMTDEWIFHYFLTVYFTVLLNYFGLNVKQIAMCLDILIGPGLNKLFSPEEILKEQVDVIPEIEKYIKEDFDTYYA